MRQTTVAAPPKRAPREGHAKNEGHHGNPYGDLPDLEHGQLTDSPAEQGGRTGQSAETTGEGESGSDHSSGNPHPAWHGISNDVRLVAWCRSTVLCIAKYCAVKTSDLPEGHMGRSQGRFLQRVRGALGMGFTWAFGWAAAGILIGVASIVAPGRMWDAFFRVFDAPLPALAVPGFIGGAIFSVVLSVVARRRAFGQLSLVRFTAWGAVGACCSFSCPTRWPHWVSPRRQKMGRASGASRR